MAAAIDVNFRWDGPADGPPLVLSHGIGLSIAMWEPQMPALSSTFRVLRFDHRGHGSSSVPKGPYRIEDLGRDLLALLDREQLARVSFCGLSLGGMVGMWLAANAPERVDRLILCCTAARMRRPEDYTERAQRVRREGLVPIVDLVINRWLTPGFIDQRPDQVAWLRALFLATKAEGYAGCCEALAAMDLRDALKRITSPTLVIAGAEDQATPLPQSEEIAASISGARLAIIPSAGHLATVEKPGVVTDEVVSYLSR